MSSLNKVVILCVVLVLAGCGSSSKDKANTGNLCFLAAGSSQLDTNGDGEPDSCDTDDDGDGIVDETDNCALQANNDQLDTNADGEGNVCDADDDGDGQEDTQDNCTLVINTDQLDSDADGKGDVCEDDIDGDGVLDTVDNCPHFASSDQLDTDTDGQGDVCDVDDDDDGVMDVIDNCRLTINTSQTDIDGDGEGDACDVDTVARPSNPDCVAGVKPATSAAVELVNAYPKLKLNDLIQVYRMPGDAIHWYGITRLGKVFKFEDSPDVKAVKTILNISKKVDSDYAEQGLLGMAFHPRFNLNKKVYLYYSLRSGVNPNDTILAEFTYADGVLKNERQILRFPKTTKNHNAGNIVFGPDGYLYISIGDDGNGRSAQDIAQLKGKILRIRVTGDGTYSVPEDNPFKVAGKPSPVFAYGFRNPWRWSFDSVTGQIWLGDVGNASFEEVNTVQMGGNYGWPYKEGFACNYPICDGVPSINPVYAYSHDTGFVIIGGVVYRGSAIPGLYGKFIFADGVNYSQVWALGNDGVVEDLMKGTLGTGGGIHSFTEDRNGDVYVNHANGVFKLVPKTSLPASKVLAVKLSETGCFKPVADTLQPVQGLIPYDVKSPLYSDGADKKRWLAIPDGTTAQLLANGDVQFPAGTVLVKEFDIGGKKIETRLMMHHSDGSWAGYTYQWNDSQKEAFLVRDGKTVSLPDFDYRIPSETQCMQCHNISVDFSIGLTSVQLDKAVTMGDGSHVNQLERFKQMALLKGNASTQSIVDYHNEANSDEDRITSYFYSNCYYCHNPEGPGRGAMDFRLDPARKWNQCGIVPQIDNLGIADARIIYPGHTEKSILYKRITATDNTRMPPLGRVTADPFIDELLKHYIETAVCP